jgi:hypothetical protein
MYWCFMVATKVYNDWDFNVVNLLIKTLAGLQLASFYTHSSL